MIVIREENNEKPKKGPKSNKNRPICQKTTKIDI